MKRHSFLRQSTIAYAVRLWLFWLFAFVIQKPLFMLWYRGLYGDCYFTDWFRVVFHGLPLDLSMASYLTVVPILLALVSIWWPKKILRIICRWWLIAAAVLVAASFLLNVVLYEYWGFPLDSTPFFYFFSSPKDALASAGMIQIVIGFTFLLFLSLLLYFGAAWAFGLRCFCKGKRMMTASQLLSTGGYIVLAGLLFICMRGGLTVSSMNTGAAYFSQHPALNHAAVNPFFSLMESFAHQEDFEHQYRFMDDQKASRLFAEMTKTGSGETEHLLTVERPDIYLIILESFSSKLMSELGGEKNVAIHLDSLSREGILFTHFHANSFRTDRGLVSILSGYPAQPTMSLMKYPHKTASLPSIARCLKQAGYSLRYYYGGDANFTNMRSYLVSQGFEKIVSDVDFPVKDRLSKWGVPDHLVFERLVSETLHSPYNQGDKKQSPLFCVLQTSSSHEPFDVPYHRLDDERLNAFAYTDDCVGRFMNSLRQSGRWNRSLVVLVPDHLGCYPRQIDNFDFSRYQIPLIFAGGAVNGSRHIDTYGSQQDLAATLLAQLGIAHDEFLFSKDMLDARAPHFAFFTVPDAFGVVDAKDSLIYDNKSAQVVSGSKGNKDFLNRGKAYLQKLYDDIAKR